MNHLKTSKERKARWYSKQKPRYLPVRPGKNWNELFCHSMDGSDNDYVLSIPINWLMMKEKLLDNQKIDNGDSKTSKKETNIGKFAAANTARATTHDDGNSRRTTTTKTNFLKEVLEKHGFAVITGVLSKSDCQSALEKAWDYIEVASFAEQQYQDLQKMNKTTTSTNDNNDDDIPVESFRKRKKKKQENHTRKLHTSTDVSILSPVKRRDPNTHWSPYFPRCVEGGMLPFYGSGHSTFAWFIRSHPNVKRVFETYYAKDKMACSHNDYDDDSSSSSSAAIGGSVLLSSLDGVVLWRSPPLSPSSLIPSKRMLCATTTTTTRSPRDDDKDCHNDSNQDYRTDAGWFHIDQNPRAKPQKAAIQGLVNLLPVTPQTGGNVVVTQSHHYFPHHYNNNNNDETSISKTFKTKTNDSTADADVSGESQVLSSSPADQQQHTQACSEFYQVRLNELEGDDWMEIDPQDTTILQPNRIIACLLGPGDMILWDSRTVHCSYPGDSTTQSNEAANFNAVDTSSNLSTPSSFGLLRAGAAVSMMPMEMTSQSVLLERRRAVDESRTLTHWVNKAAPLGEERSDQVVMEDKCVQFVKQYQHDILTSGKVLLEYKDLSDEQKQMVAGSMAEENAQKQINVFSTEHISESKSD